MLSDDGRSSHKGCHMISIDPMAHSSTDFSSVNTSEVLLPSNEEYQSESRTPTPRIDSCTTETANLINISGGLSSLSVDVDHGQPHQNETEERRRLIASTRSPVTWPGKGTAKPKTDSHRPAFVYCGPGSKRIPGVVAWSNGAPHTVAEALFTINTTLKKQPCIVPRVITATRRSTKKMAYRIDSTQSCRRQSAIEEQILKSSVCDLILPGCNISSITSKAVGDSMNRSTPTNTRTTVRTPYISTIGASPMTNVGTTSGLTECLDLTQSRPDSTNKNMLSGDELTAIWHGPDILTIKACHWLFVSNVNTNAPSNDVILSGLIISPAIYIRTTDGSNRSMLIESEHLHGTIRVANRAYEKYVTVRASHDKWQNYTDQPAKYFASSPEIGSSGYKYDTFVFGFVLPKESEEFEFALHYRWAPSSGMTDVANGHDRTGGSAWDNNDGQNYILRRKPNVNMDPFSLFQLSSARQSTADLR